MGAWGAGDIRGEYRGSDDAAGELIFDASVSPG
jgi:hypothetical protein